MYGENSSTLRFEFSNLLRLTRRRRLDPANDLGRHDSLAPAVDQVQRYRQNVLFWTQHALEASGRPFNLDNHRQFARGPIEELRAQVDDAIKTASSPVSSLDDLGERQDSVVAESWRRAARAAAMGEGDFIRGFRPGHQHHNQAMTLLTDASEILQALLVLDRHLAVLPGWRALDPSSSMARAAAVCVTHASFSQADYLLDLRGWRPPLRFVSGPPEPGLRGVVQSETNTLACLAEFPDSGNLRIVLDAQRAVSHYAAHHLRDAAPELAATWAARAVKYQRLVQATRDLASLQGNGARAAGQAALAARRAQDLGQDAAPLPEAAQQLATLFTRIDDRLSTTLVTGIEDGTYLQETALPRLDLQSGGLIRSPRVRYIPVAPPTGIALSDLARALKPDLGPPRVPHGAAQSRRELRQALSEHRDRPHAPIGHQL